MHTEPFELPVERGALRSAAVPDDMLASAIERLYDDGGVRGTGEP